ncbi:MAG TPA: DUF349 domain-containing protein [Sporichthya sp.]|nr:DUF349 domain-containing protein [Sporichthya sp.]
MSETPEQVDGDQPGELTHAQVAAEPTPPVEASTPTAAQPEAPAPPEAPPAPEPQAPAEAPVAPEAPPPAAPEAEAPPAAEAPAPEPGAPASEPPAVTPADIPAHAAVPGPAAAAEPAGPPVNRDEWGYVDAEGTVFVRTAAGDRAIGSWQAGPPAEALEFYGRRYDGLALEIDLLDHRIRETDVPEKEARTAIERIKAALVDVAAIGDLAALDARIAALDELAKSRAAVARAARAKVIAETKVLKERIVADVEAIGAGTEWRVGGDRIRALLEEWKAAPRLDRKSDDELWSRFSAARSAFSKRRKAHYAELTATRDTAKAAKEALVAKAEALAGSTDWGATSDAFRNLMKEWKTSGRAARDVDDALWERFKGAQDQFFAARNNTFAAKDAELAANLAAKEALVVEAERLLPVTDAASARAALRGITERWEKAGSLPRDARGRVESRLSAVEAAVRAAEDAARQRSNPAAKARAQETVDSLLAAIAKYEKQADKARASGNAKAIADAEAAVAARREWLVEAEKMLAEFS